jgi:ribosome recycling factor
VPQVERLKIQCVPTRQALLSGRGRAGAIIELIQVKNPTKQQRAELVRLRKSLTEEDRFELKRLRAQAVNAAKRAAKGEP